MIYNFTQHAPSAEQLDAGVVALSPELEARVRSLLTFDEIPEPVELCLRAVELATLAHELGAKFVMIGGAPFFMGTLESTLLMRGIQPVYAFSKRVSTEENGVKTSVFKHLGFVHVVDPTPVTVNDESHEPCPTCELVMGYCGGSDHPSCGVFQDGYAAPRVAAP